MPVFRDYSNYYNLLYKDKDYAGEAEYIQRLISCHHRGAETVLDLGCGTGRHDLLLAGMGYRVSGVDQSEEMLAVAGSHDSVCRFHHGDIRSVRLDEKFDVVVSLFHVMSYQVTTEDLRAALATAKAHLNPNGIFIFDFWYGPAVLTDRPAVRVKRLEDEAIAVTRVAEPVMYPNDNSVDVNYQVFIRNKASGRTEELCETHRMRYLFRPELDLLLKESGLSIVEIAEWMTGKAPGFDTWGVCCVVRG
ncbi:MAG: class I SAM-dependent DNA methyltransferase [Desulfuromonadaceae bacterium]